MPEFLAVAMLMLFVGAFALVITISMLRSALRINDMVRNQERIIEELQRINGQSSSHKPN